MTDFKIPIVMDTGSGLMKAGFADQDLPNVIFPTIIGIPKYEVKAVGQTLNILPLFSPRMHSDFMVHPVQIILTRGFTLSGNNEQ